MGSTGQRLKEKAEAGRREMQGQVEDLTEDESRGVRVGDTKLPGPALAAIAIFVGVMTLSILLFMVLLGNFGIVIGIIAGLIGGLYAAKLYSESR